MQESNLESLQGSLSVGISSLSTYSHDDDGDSSSQTADKLACNSVERSKKSSLSFHASDATREQIRAEEAACLFDDEPGLSASCSISNSTAGSVEQLSDAQTSPDDKERDATQGNHANPDPNKFNLESIHDEESSCQKTAAADGPPPNDAGGKKPLPSRRVLLSEGEANDVVQGYGKIPQGSKTKLYRRTKPIGTQQPDKYWYCHGEKRRCFRSLNEVGRFLKKAAPPVPKPSDISSEEDSNGITSSVLMAATPPVQDTFQSKSSNENEASSESQTSLWTLEAAGSPTSASRHNETTLESADSSDNHNSSISAGKACVKMCPSRRSPRKVRRVGDAVKSYFFQYRKWYNGIIQSRDGGHANIRFQDDDHFWDKKIPIVDLEDAEEDFEPMSDTDTITDNEEDAIDQSPRVLPPDPESIQLSESFSIEKLEEHIKKSTDRLFFICHTSKWEPSRRYWRLVQVDPDATQDYQDDDEEDCCPSGTFIVDFFVPHLSDKKCVEDARWRPEMYERKFSFSDTGEEAFSLENFIHPNMKFDPHKHTTYSEPMELSSPNIYLLGPFNFDPPRTGKGRKSIRERIHPQIWQQLNEIATDRGLSTYSPFQGIESEPRQLKDKKCPSLKTTENKSRQLENNKRPSPKKRKQSLQAPRTTKAKKMKQILTFFFGSCAWGLLTHRLAHEK